MRVAVTTTGGAPAAEAGSIQEHSPGTACRALASQIWERQRG